MKQFIALMTLLLLGFTTNSHAQFEPKSYSFSPTIGLYTFDQHQKLKSSALVGLRISRYLTSRWAMEAVLQYIPTESKTKVGSDNEVSGLLYNLDGLYHFPTKSKWLPFLAAGVGGITFSGSDTGADSNLMLNYGAGVKYLYSDQVSLRADVRQVFVDDNSIEHNRVYTVGLEFYWGKGGASAKSETAQIGNDSGSAPRVAQQERAPASAGAAALGDSDKDGVPDAHDFCANTPLGVSVDSDGCPVDRDGDGTPDYLDKCPDTPKGLITDKNGCTLDTDQDGVSDSRDYCADTPLGVAVDEKGCPKSAGSEADSDGDGVLNEFDKCPNTPKGTRVDENGCPMEIKEKTTTQSHIRFETGESKIRPAYTGEVGRIADYLKKFPKMVIEIEGHTDTTGPEKLNKRLSLDRAESLKSALVTGFGIKASRLKTRGYSWNRPIADNKTAEGREKNRRVVVTLSPVGK